MTIRLAHITNDSIVDGPGLRLAVFAQGCGHNCPGCHNPQTHDPKGGYEVEIDEIMKMLVKNPLLDGITLTGGEPFLQVVEMGSLAKKAKELGLEVMVYTGFTWEELMENPQSMELLRYTDTLVDGRFIKELASLGLGFKGSANQREIDVREELSKIEGK